MRPEIWLMPDAGGRTMIVVVIGAMALVSLIGMTLWRHFGLSLKLSRFSSMVHHGQAAEALHGLRLLENRHHGDIRVHQLLGQGLMVAGEYGQAAREWEIVHLINRHERVLALAEIAGPLADCQMALGEWRDAQGGLLLALKACPGEVGLLERLAMVYLKRGMARHAVSCYENILKLEGEEIVTILKMATVQEIAGDLRGALASALHVLRLDAKNGPAALMAARLYAGFGNHASAEPIWRGLAARKEYRGEGLTGLAACLEAQPGRTEDTVDAWLEVLQVTETKTERLEVLYRMASLLLQSGDIRKGVLLLEEIVNLEPGYRDAARQLERYGDLYAGGDIGRFATGSIEEFRPVSGKILDAFGITVLRDKVTRKRDLVVHGVVGKEGKRETVLVHFSRSLSALGERDLQEVADEMRVLRGKHAWVFSVVGFSDDAKAFARSRQMSLIERDEIRTLLGMGFVPGLTAGAPEKAGGKPVVVGYEKAATNARLRQSAGVA